MISKASFAKSLPFAVLIIFATFFCLESFVNHYLFRTYALDLGMFNNAIFDFAHFRPNNTTLLFDLDNQRFLGSHFSLLPILFSPLVYLTGSYTLLLMQILSILWGGWGIYTYFKWKTNKLFFPTLAMLHFFLVWTIYSALSFDYHDNVPAAMLLPWFFYYFEREKRWQCMLYFILIVVAKENMAIWMAFVCLGLALMHFRNKPLRNVAVLLMGFSVVFSCVIIGYLIPAYADAAAYRNGQLVRYSLLGDTWTELLSTLFKRPLYTLSLLFENTTGSAYCDGIKTELHYMVLIAGGWALIMRPAFLVMLLPIYAQKMFSSDVALWGIDGQYSIEFAPILTFAVFSFLATLPNNLLRNILIGIAILITGISTLVKMEPQVLKGGSKANLALLQSCHYKRDLNVQAAYDVLKLIPKDVPVSTHSVFVPHLALRDKIYCFPRIEDAQYILLPTEESVVTWPQPRQDYDRDIENAKSSGCWQTIYNKDNLLLLKRIK
jgi:uncharacterized membrane protein